MEVRAPQHVSDARAWNTWDPLRPGALVHLPSGFAVRVSAYSAKENRYTHFPFAPAVRLGPHLPDASYVELELPHAGSRLRLRFAKPSDPGTVVGDVEVVELGEWGLRFWYVVAIGVDAAHAGARAGRDGPEDGPRFRLRRPPGEAAYVDPPVAFGSWAGGLLAFVPSMRPVGAHLYDDPGDAREEFERHGYYARPPDRSEGRWAMFRFNAVERRVGFAVSLGDDEADAARKAGEALARVEEVLRDREAEAAAWPERAAAIRDVLTWNTVWDSANGRSYTAATRAWVTERFGGWMVWQQDAFYHALLAVHAGDDDTARANLDAALSCATPYGNLAALRSGRTDWVDRSHPPIGAHVVRELYRRTGDRSILERAYPFLRRAFDWWFEARDGNGNGLLEYGSSPVGDGHFVHTKLAAMDESAMDNSPIHDEATFDVAAHTLDVEDVALNSLLVLEGRGLACVAEELGSDGSEAAELRQRSDALAARVRDRLWDGSRRVFANRLWSGRFARSLAPTSFYPMLAGIATREQADALVREHLVNRAEFWGDHPVAGTAHDDPASRDDVYWRGRVWPPMNYLVWLGLKRYGFEAEARELALKGRAMFERGWSGRRSYENFNQRTGEGGDSVDTDPFYTWGALLPLVAELDEAGDVGPWP